MRKKAQVLIIFLWILSVFVILVIATAARAMATFKFACIQKDRQKALYLAKAGIIRAALTLESDTNANDYDALGDEWADNKEEFAKVGLSDSENEFAEISYSDPESGEPVFGVRDEERKINLNTASEPLLTVLLEKSGVAEAASVANNIRVWRGDPGVLDTSEAYVKLGYAPKGAKFTNTEELMLVAGISPEDYLKIKDIVTVYTQGKININTVSEEVLLMVCEAIAPELGKGVAQEIIIARNSHDGYFSSLDQIPDPQQDVERNVYSSLAGNITVTSKIFFIEVNAKVGRIDKKITAVYDRDPERKKFLYWHES